MKKSLKTQSGLTLIELSIAIGIAIAIVVIAIKPASTLFANASTTAELNDLPTIVFNIQKISKGKPNFTGATINEYARLNAFPEDRRTIPSSGNATVSNRWGGNVTGAPANLTGTNDIFRLVSPGIPNSECVDVVQGAASLMRRVYVDSANSGTAGAGTIVKADGAQLDTGALATSCGALNSITYDIGK